MISLACYDVPKDPNVVSRLRVRATARYLALIRCLLL